MSLSPAVRRALPALLVLVSLAGCTGEIERSMLERDGGSVRTDGGGPRPDGTVPIEDGSMPEIDGDVPPADGGADGGPTDPCATVTCGANEVCDPAMGATCVCAPGFVDMGSGCVAVPPGDPAGRTMAEVCEQWRAGHVENASPPWIAGSGMCDPGMLSSVAIDDTIRRVNLFRWLAGLGPVVNNAGEHAAQQECAVMMTANSALDHMPPSSWDCYTSGGAAAAGRSNLALGVRSSPQSIDLYMDDSGVSSLGHRRWVLNGPLGRVGIGFAGNAQCLSVFDGSGSSDRAWTSYPNPGPAPIETSSALWSFHSNRSDLRSASVTVVRVSDGTELPVSVSHPPNGFGPSTVAWDPQGWAPEAGQQYRVTVSGFDGGPVTYVVSLVSC